MAEIDWFWVLVGYVLADVAGPIFTALIGSIAERRRRREIVRHIADVPRGEGMTSRPSGPSYWGRDLGKHPLRAKGKDDGKDR